MASAPTGEFAASTAYPALLMSWQKLLASMESAWRIISALVVAHFFTTLTGCTTQVAFISVYFQSIAVVFDQCTVAYPAQAVDQ